MILRSKVFNGCKIIHEKFILKIPCKVNYFEKNLLGSIFANFDHIYLRYSRLNIS